MTRLAVLADIHGNLPALQAVIKDMAQFAVDQVVVAGDSVNWGPFSREVMEVVSAGGWAAICGNNELYALDFETPRMPPHWSSFTLPPILREQLGADWLNAIACLPDELCLRFLDAPALRVFHGVPGDPFQRSYPAQATAKSGPGLRLSMSQQSSALTVISPWNGMSTAGTSSIRVQSASPWMAS